MEPVSQTSTMSSARSARVRLEADGYVVDHDYGPPPFLRRNAAGGAPASGSAASSQAGSSTALLRPGVPIVTVSQVGDEGHVHLQPPNHRFVRGGPPPPLPPPRPDSVPLALATNTQLADDQQHVDVSRNTVL